MRITNAERYGKAIRDARKNLGLTQAAVASACGTGIRFIVDLEHGKPTCELEKALRVAQMLGIVMEANLPEISQGSSE
jgi:HTH-type transcriptional regulator / antitoxin HipB